MSGQMVLLFVLSELDRVYHSSIDAEPVPIKWARKPGKTRPEKTDVHSLYVVEKASGEHQRWRLLLQQSKALRRRAIFARRYT